MVRNTNSLLINPHSPFCQTDHFVTQRNPDGTVRDFVDFDANTIAIAFGAATPDQAAKILNRIDHDYCAHAKATYVSERYYDSNNCYQHNTGDSNTTMGRIGLAFI